jgi:hypothetical protein
MHWHAALSSLPPPLHTHIFFLAVSYTGRSSLLRRCGMWKLPVPRFFAAPPAERRSTSFMSGRHTRVIATTCRALRWLAAPLAGAARHALAMG